MRQLINGLIRDLTFDPHRAQTTVRRSSSANGLRKQPGKALLALIQYLEEDPPQDLDIQAGLLMVLADLGQVLKTPVPLNLPYSELTAWLEWAIDLSWRLTWGIANRPKIQIIDRRQLAQLAAWQALWR